MTIDQADILLIALIAHLERENKQLQMEIMGLLTYAKFALVLIGDSGLAGSSNFRQNSGNSADFPF